MPPGALRAPISVVIVPLEAWPSGALGQVFDIEPSGIQFATPATITYTFEDAELAGANPAALRLGLAEGPNWTPLVSRVDLVRHLVSASIPHLSVYGLLAPTSWRIRVLPTAGQPPKAGRRWPTQHPRRRRRQSRKRPAKMHKRAGRLRLTGRSFRNGVRTEASARGDALPDGRARPRRKARRRDKNAAWGWKNRGNRLVWPSRRRHQERCGHPPRAATQSPRLMASSRGTSRTRCRSRASESGSSKVPLGSPAATSSSQKVPAPKDKHSKSASFRLTSKR